jgi:hypothetical protein
VQRDEGDGRILLSDNRGKGEIILRRIRLQCAMACTSPHSLVFRYVVDHMHSQLRIAQNSHCAGPSGTYLLRKSGNVCKYTFDFFLAHKKARIVNMVFIYREGAAITNCDFLSEFQEL